MDARGSEPSRPKRVIILDADDPLIEVKGRIVWHEAHERIVDATRRQAFRDGYDAALRERSEAPAHHLAFRRRRSVLAWMRLVIAASLALFVLLYLLLLLQG